MKYLKLIFFIILILSFNVTAFALNLEVDDNLNEFKNNLSLESSEPNFKGNSNESKIIDRLEVALHQENYLTDTSINYIKKSLNAFKKGVVPKNISKRIVKKIQQENDPREVLSILKDNLYYSMLNEDNYKIKNGNNKIETVLSLYLKKED